MSSVGSSSHYLCCHDLVLIDGEMEVLGEAPITGGELRTRASIISLTDATADAKPTDSYF